MTAHNTLFDRAPAPAYASDGSPALPARRLATTGEAIPARLAHMEGCRCPTCNAGRRIDLALADLATYLKEEGPGLSRVLRLLDLRGGLTDLAALDVLHVDPGTEAEALARAEACLDRIHEDLAETPARPTCVTPVPAEDRTLAREITAAICWYGARTADILATVRRALG